MPEVSVKQYAEVIQIPVERLLEQLEEPVWRSSPRTDSISDNEKTELLGYRGATWQRASSRAGTNNPEKENPQ